MTHIPNIQTSANFWALAVDVWDHGFMGIAVGRITLAIFILVMAAVVRRLFTYAILRHIRFWFRRSKHTIDDAIFEALAPPIRFIPFVLAIFVISEFITANPRLGAIFAGVNRSLLAFTLFWALFEIIGPLFSSLDGRRAIFSRAMLEWAVRVVKILVVALGAVTILEVWGIQVAPILAGLGLFGVAVALGAQDLFKNLIAGIFIIGERRFQNGDWILAENVVEGAVETIGLRTTKVRRFDMAPVYVPNSKLADNAVTNFAQMTYRRISWTIGLKYNTSVDQLRHIRDGIEAYILGSADFAHPPDGPAFVRIDKFNDSSIDLMVYCFTRTTDWGEWLKIKEALTYAIKDVVEQAGSDFAFPSRSIYVETMPAGAEVFPSHQQAPGA
jgi:MscS family membrane protein